jgi:hypothetical protein
MIINSIHFTFSPKDAAIAESLLRELRDASQRSRHSPARGPMFAPAKPLNVVMASEFDPECTFA